MKHTRLGSLIFAAYALIGPAIVMLSMFSGGRHTNLDLRQFAFLVWPFWPLAGFSDVALWTGIAILLNILLFLIIGVVAGAFANRHTALAFIWAGTFVMLFLFLWYVVGYLPEINFVVLPIAAAVLAVPFVTLAWLAKREAVQ